MGVACVASPCKIDLIGLVVGVKVNQSETGKEALFVFVLFFFSSLCVLSDWFQPIS